MTALDRTARTGPKKTLAPTGASRFVAYRREAPITVGEWAYRFRRPDTSKLM